MVAFRFRQQQTWWIISQLVRRTPEFRLHQSVDFLDGEMLVLTLASSATFSPEECNRIRVAFGREGVTVVTPTETGTMPWDKALAAQGSLDVVRGIEIGLGLTPAIRSPKREISDVDLAYTVLALLLAARVHDRHPWQVRSVAPVLLGLDDWGLADLSMFPVLERNLMARFELDVLRGIRPAGVSAWVLYCGVDPVAAFDEYGSFHYEETRFSLREIHDGTGGRIHSTAQIVATSISG